MAQTNTAALTGSIRTPLAVQTLTLLAVIIVWETISRTGILFAELFPPIIEVLHSLWRYMTTPLILPHLRASLYEIGGVVS